MTLDQTLDYSFHQILGEVVSKLSKQMAFKRVKSLKEIFGIVIVGDNFRVRTNYELYEHLSSINVLQRYNIHLLSWLMPDIRIDGDHQSK